MPYVGKEPVRGQNRELDDISGSFNGGNTAFTMQVGGVNTAAGSANQVFISVGGIMQNPGTDFTVSSSTITFTTPPANGLDFWGLIQGDAVDINTPADGSVTAAKLASGAGIAVLTGSTNNTVTTVTGAGAIQGEANLTFDGNDLAVGAGNLNVSKPATPTVLVQNSTDTSFSTVKLQQSSGSGGYFAINKLGTNSSATGGANAAQIWQSGAAPIVIGVNNTEEARFLSGGGLTFNGDTAAANALSDYEYGTWTPSFNALSTGSVTTNYAKYVKVGHLVHVTFYVSVSSTSTNDFEMSMPFTNSNNGSWNPITLQRSASSVDICIGRVQENSTQLRVITAVGDSALSYANLNGQWVIAAGTYLTET